MIPLLRARFSLIEMLALTFVLGLGFAALRTGGVLASLALFGGLIAVIAATIAAVIGHDRVRIFSIGFLIASGIYAGAFYFFGENELHPYSGRLPTTRLVEPLRTAMTTITFLDTKTGKEVSAETADVWRNSANSDNWNRAETVQSPDPADFLSVAHLLVGLLLGYAGGKFALTVHRRSLPTPPDA
ncbi:MAG TPA: hypothetical protein VGN57_09960 [Pirellulaceae bacterium]|jgi:hypothetical protein|nr:hypothetical protein [Pirellulaceae bacterium]